MRRIYEVSGGRDQHGNFHPPDDQEMMRKLLGIREHLEDFGGLITVAPKRVRIVDDEGNTLRWENWGLIFKYDSSAPAAELQEGEQGEPEAELDAQGGEPAPEPAGEPQAASEPAVTE